MTLNVSLVSAADYEGGDLVFRSATASTSSNLLALSLPYNLFLQRSAWEYRLHAKQNCTKRRGATGSASIPPSCSGDVSRSLGKTHT
jgi:hypothetical protein